MRVRTRAWLCFLSCFVAGAVALCIVLTRADSPRVVVLFTGFTNSSVGARRCAFTITNSTRNNAIMLGLYLIETNQDTARQTSWMLPHVGQAQLRGLPCGILVCLDQI